MMVLQACEPHTVRNGSAVNHPMLAAIAPVA